MDPLSSATNNDDNGLSHLCRGSAEFGPRAGHCTNRSGETGPSLKTHNLTMQAKGRGKERSLSPLYTWGTKAQRN